MSQPPVSAPPRPAAPPLYSRRRGPACEALMLTEINPQSVIDLPPEAGTPIELQSCGTVREPCPKCQKPCLNLILRQTYVRSAHLMCPDCRSCYDAHYAGGAPALTI